MKFIFIFRMLPIALSMFHRFKNKRFQLTSRLNLSQPSFTSQSKNEVINGDATLIKTYSLLMGNEKSIMLADALITDPPYCILERRRKNGDLRDPKRVKKKIDEDPTVSRFENVKIFTSFTKSWLELAVKFIKPTAPVIIWTNSLGKAPTINLCKQLNYTFVGEFLWAKRTKIMTKDEILTSTKNEVLLRIYETALVFQPTLQINSNNETPRLVQLNPNDKAISWSCVTGYHDDNDSNNNITAHAHPCHKPFESIEPLIRTWTKPGDVILDCFAGSGGIVCSAVQLNRVVKGIEILPEWCDYTNTKLREMSG